MTTAITGVRLKAASGLSIIEILIVLTVIGILSSYALPSFSKLLNSNRQQAVLFQLYRHHQLARSEAIKQNQSVILCKSDNGGFCTPSANWHDGWIVFADTDSNRQLSANEQLIYSFQNQNYFLSLTYRGFGSHNYIRYYPDGRSSTNGSFVLCTPEGDTTAKSMIISRTGRARISSENANGAALVCN